MNYSGCGSKFSTHVRPATVAMLAASLLLAGCGASRIVDRSGSGRDAAPVNPPVNIDTITDAVPQPEPLSSTGNSPYKVFGVRYVPMQQSRGYSETGVASWYGTKFHGRKTSSGEEYDMFGMTAAHTTLPLPTYATVQNLENGRKIVVKINDRGPFANNRLIDLSYVAAYKLDMVKSGTAKVRVTAIDTGKNFASDDMRNRPIVAGYSNPSTTGPVVAESIFPGPVPAGSEISYGQAAVAAGAAAGTYSNASQTVTAQSAYGQAAGAAVSTYNTGVQTVTGQTANSPGAYSQTSALPATGSVTTYNTTAAQTGYQTQPVTTANTNTNTTGYQATPGYTVWQSGTSTYQSAAAATGVSSTQMPPLNPASTGQITYPTSNVQYQTQTEPAWQTYQSGQTGETVTYQSAQSVDYASNAPVPPSPYTPPAQSRGIYVQVGAFSDRTNADKVQLALQQRGFTPVNVMPVARAAGTLYRVRIGPMPDYALADAELARLTNSISFGGRPRVVVE